MDRYLSIPTIAKALDTPPRTVRRWLSSGRLPGGVRIGRAWRVHEADLRAYLDARRSTPRPSQPPAA